MLQVLWDGRTWDVNEFVREGVREEVGCRDSIKKWENIIKSMSRKLFQLFHSQTSSDECDHGIRSLNVDQNACST